MTTKDHMKFPRLCRELRQARRLRQREVAEALGVKGSTYANVESNNHRTIREDRAIRLADYYSLNDSSFPTRAEFLAAWGELPPSDYGQRLAKKNGARRELRAKAKNHDSLRRSLTEILGLLVTVAPKPSELCTCDPGDLFEDRLCEVCTALSALGLPRWTSENDVIAALAKLQGES